MRSLILTITFVSLAYSVVTKAETKCSEVNFTSQSLQQKLAELADSFLQTKTLLAKKEKATALLEKVNCELERTSNLPLDHEYRWSLADAHAVLTDLATVNVKSSKTCKFLEEKMAFHESNQGTASDEALPTKNLALAKKLAKNFCQLAK